jgi:small-conductance mechanosensitive channel
MFSPQYFSQFGSELWYAAQKSLYEIQWPGNRFFARQGWIVFFHGFLSLIIIVAIFKKRQRLNEFKRWQFLAVRPFSAGLFLGTVTTLSFYVYEGTPAMWRLVYTLIGGISFARLSGVLIETTWKRHFIYGLVTFVILIRLMYVLNLPLPLFRLYVVLTALIAFFLCLRWAGESDRHKDSAFYTWSLRMGSMFFVLIIIMELWGKAVLAEHLFVSLILSIVTALSTVLFMHLIRGGLEWVFHSSPLRRAKVLYSDTDAIIRQVAVFIGVALWGLVLLPAILMIWGVYNNLEEAIKGLLAFGFNLGSQRISIGLLIASAGVLYGAFLISWILQKLLRDEVLLKRQVERGIRLSIGRLAHYVLIFAGFLLALSTLGFDFTKLTIVLSALGVGIGFGLQGVANNFVSGLILLFERPVRVGDYVEINGQWSQIKRIGIRSTTVQTFDLSDVIIPNADLVNNQVTNWTLSSRKARLTIPVGVAYGSDVPLVMETLMACAKENPLVDKTLEPLVLFMSFGESSLDFILRVWVADADYRLKLTSELHQEIDRRFREAKIEIAFPQRDLHLRSLDETVVLQPSETKV